MGRQAAHKSAGSGKKLSQQLPAPSPAMMDTIDEDDNFLQTQLPVEYEPPPTPMELTTKRSSRRRITTTEDNAVEEPSSEVPKDQRKAPPESSTRKAPPASSSRKPPPESLARKTRSGSTPHTKNPPAPPTDAPHSQTKTSAAAKVTFSTEKTPRMASLTAAAARLEAEPEMDDMVIVGADATRDDWIEDDDEMNRKPAARPTPPRTETAPPSRQEATRKVAAMEQASAATTEEAIMSVDDCKEIAKKHLVELYFDMIENEQELILADETSRKIHWFALQELLAQYTYSTSTYGRVFCRTKLCGLLVDVCTDPNDTVPNLSHYDVDEWKELLEDLEVTHRACLRNDCTAHIPHDHENPVQREDRASLAAFGKQYIAVTNSCGINSLLAPIRAKLQKQLESGRSGPPQLNPTKVQTLLTEARHSDSDTVKRWIYSLFVPQEESTRYSKTTTADDRDVPTPHLKNLEDLEGILQDKPFNLDWLEKKLVDLIDSWDNICFGSYVPALLKLNYKGRKNTQFHNLQRPKRGNRLALQTTPKSRRRKQLSPPRSREGRRRFADEIENLKRSRQALREDHGEDPLETSREWAEQATGVARAASKKQRVERTPEKSRDDEDENNNVPTSSDTAKSKRRAFYAKKSNTTQIRFDDTDEEDDDTSLPNRVRLGDVPRRSDATEDGTVGGTPMKTYVGPPPDEGYFDVCGNVVKRHPWVAEEISALVAGLEKHGVGRWVPIKNEYGQILRNRNSVQLKDKYRNMKKNGELPDRFL